MNCFKICYILFLFVQVQMGHSTRERMLIKGRIGKPSFSDAGKRIPPVLPTLQTLVQQCSFWPRSHAPFPARPPGVAVSVPEESRLGRNSAALLRRFPAIVPPLCLRASLYEEPPSEYQSPPIYEEPPTDMHCDQAFFGSDRSPARKPGLYHSPKQSPSPYGQLVLTRQRSSTPEKTPNQGDRDYSSSGRDYSSAGRDYSSSGLDYSSGMRDYSSGGRDYNSSGREYSAAGREYVKQLVYVEQSGSSPRFRTTERLLSYGTTSSNSLSAGFSYGGSFTLQHSHDLNGGNRKRKNRKPSLPGGEGDGMGSGPRGDDHPSPAGMGGSADVTSARGRVFRPGSERRVWKWRGDALATAWPSGAGV